MVVALMLLITLSSTQLGYVASPTSESSCKDCVQNHCYCHCFVVVVVVVAVIVVVVVVVVVIFVVKSESEGEAYEAVV